MTIVCCARDDSLWNQPLYIHVVFRLGYAVFSARRTRPYEVNLARLIGLIVLAKYVSHKSGFVLKSVSKLTTSHPMLCAEWPTDCVHEKRSSIRIHN